VLVITISYFTTVRCGLPLGWLVGADSSSFS
jgi:hypothetical protein